MPTDTALVLPAHFAAIRKDVTLSRRDIDIMQEVTEWQITHTLQPTLICKSCFDNARPNTLDAADQWTIIVSDAPSGAIEAVCGCSRWSTDVSQWGFGKHVYDPIKPPPDVAVMQMIGKLQRPLGPGEARLFEAWKAVKDSHHWAESMKCGRCFSRNASTANAPAIVIPGKKISINCECTEREYVYTGVK